MTKPDPQFQRLLHLIGALAIDVHDTFTINEHIDSIEPHGPNQMMLRRVVCLATGETGSGYHDDRVWIDHLHSVLGYPHRTLVDTLRTWAAANDPALDDPNSQVNIVGPHYAKRRQRGALVKDGQPRRPALRLVMDDETGDRADRADRVDAET
jgi:hypothetical protein